MMYDMLGRTLVRQTRAMSAGQHLFQVSDMSRYSSGLYFLQISQGNQSQVKRLVFVK